MVPANIGIKTMRHDDRCGGVPCFGLFCQKFRGYFVDGPSFVTGHSGNFVFGFHSMVEPILNLLVCMVSGGRRHRPRGRAGGVRLRWMRVFHKRALNGKAHSPQLESPE